MCYERRDPEQARACFERDQRKVEYIERERIAMGVLGLTIVDPMVAQYADAVLLQIKQAPAADVVPVVRCVNCIHYGAEASAFDAWTPFCLKHKLTTFPDDFCSYGERKGGE